MRYICAHVHNVCVCVCVSDQTSSSTTNIRTNKTKTTLLNDSSLYATTSFVIPNNAKYNNLQIVPQLASDRCGGMGYINALNQRPQKN